MYVSFFGPFFDWVFYFSGLSYRSCLYIFEINPFSVASFAIIFSHYEDYFFTLLTVPFAVQKILSLIRFPLVYFCFYFHYCSRWVMEDLPLCHRVFCLFSSMSFIVSGHIFRSLIHFEFIFVYGVRRCSNFILLHLSVQFSQHHLLKRLS